MRQRTWCVLRRLVGSDRFLRWAFLRYLAVGYELVFSPVSGRRNANASGYDGLPLSRLGCDGNRELAVSGRGYAVFSARWSASVLTDSFQNA